MRTEFVHRTRPQTVHFGEGLTARIPDLLDADMYRHTYIIASPRMENTARALADALGGRCAGWEAGSEMHVPAETVSATLKNVDTARADSLLTIGGGSPIGLAKAVVLERRIPIAAVPTTYAGSEMTAVWGITRNGVKHTGQDENVRPHTVAYDVALTAGLPTRLTLTSGYNAIAHAMEALYAPDATPATDLQAEEGAARLFRALSVLVDEESVRARTDALVGAWLCGSVLGATTMSLHHKLCHVLGGTFGLPHATAHAVLLPYVLTFHASAAPEMLSALHRATHSEEPAVALRELAARAAVPTSLRDMGMPRSGLTEVAAQACAAPYANPRQVTEGALRELLERAWAGEPA